MQQRIQLGEDLKNLLLDGTALPDKFVVNGKEYTPHRPVKAGFKGAIWQVSDEHGRSRAAKLAIAQDYDDRSYLQELALAAKLEKYGEFARIIDAGITEVTLREARFTFVCFIEEWVEGQSLLDFIRDNSREVGAPFLVAYVDSVTRALQALAQENLRHDDLHTGNVLIAEPIGTGVLGNRTIKIVDNGSLKPADVPTKKDKDDHENFVDHIVQIWNITFRHKTLPVRDKRFLREAERLLSSMLDRDSSVALRDPTQISDRFKEAYTRSALPLSEPVSRLQSPFEFLSAEHIADDRILVGIFARSCPWLPKVSGRDPCLVTGPRGCGKSTIFRWLSLKAHLHLSDPDLDALQVSGFYISCSTDLQNRLGWIRTPAIAQNFESAIIHFFNLLAAREILYTLELISQRPDHETRWGLGDVQEGRICEFIDSALGQNATLRLQGLPRLAQLRGRLEAEMFATHTDWLSGKVRQPVTPKSFLGDFTTLLVALMPYFQRKTIAFLVDDFSVHRLPEPVQVVLNRVVWERRSSHVFKLSAEKYGATLSDIFDSTAEPTRELTEVDCGKEFIALDDSRKNDQSYQFAIELLNNRLKRASYKGTAQQIIGSSQWHEGSLAKALIAKKSGGRNEQYHGLECISQLCSGDVATLLMVYRRIFELGHIGKNSMAPVSKRIQDEAIRSVSRKLFDAVRAYFPYGPDMYSVANEFGNLVRRILTDGRWQKVGQSRVPAQIPRIEIDQDAGAATDQLNDEQKKLATELIRRSIFIEMDAGLSRHQNVTTLRWHFRRVFLPTFGAALAKNDAVKRKPDWLKWFLTAPREACHNAWQTFPRGNSGSRTHLQTSLPLNSGGRRR